MPSAARWRKVKTHLTYTYDEAARVTGTHKRTVMGWGRKGLPVLADQKPHLIRGADLRNFLSEATTRRKTRLQLNQFYCLKCRDAREAAEGMVDCNLPETGPGMLEGPCSACLTTMYKRIARNRIAELSGNLDVTIKRGDRTL